MKNTKLLRCCLSAVLFISMISVYGQENFRSTYYEQRRTLFESLPNDKKEIIFLGNSITDGGEWSELFRNKKIKNRGISGDITRGVLFRLAEVTESKPSKVFLLIGINDLARGISREEVYENICRIAREIQKQSPRTTIFIQSIFPVNPSFEMFAGHCSKTNEVRWINEQLKTFCTQTDFQYVDVFTRLKNESDDYLNPSYTNDGLHLTGEGYLVWADVIRELL